MEKEKEKEKEEFFINLSSKTNICFIIFIELMNIFNSFIFFLGNFTEIYQIYSELKNIKFLYFNKDKIKNILYKEDKIIEIKFKVKKKEEYSLHNYFYLSNLINDEPNTIYYNFSINIIININKKNNNEKNILKKIMISKILIELINYYPQVNECNDDIKKELNKIKDMNLDIINNNINNIEFFEKINLNCNIEKIKSKNSEEIYNDIIIALIKSNNFEDIKDIEDITENLKQLDIEKIDITQNIFNKLLIILNSNENNINQYNINNINDLFENKKINFYYILFKYIIKNTIYIYFISFLNIIRINILKTIKKLDLKKYGELENNEELKSKFDYIFKFITNSKYYLENKIKKQISQDNEEIKKESKIDEVNNGNQQENIDDNKKNCIYSEKGGNEINTGNDKIINSSNPNKEKNYCKSSQIEASNGDSTTFFSSNGSKEKNESKKEQNSKHNNNFSKDSIIINFVKKILKFSCFLFKNDEKGEINYYILNDDEINYTNNDSEEKDLKLNENNKGKENEILRKNIIKFINFIDYIKDLLEKNFFNKYNLIIKLIFKLENNYPDKNDFYDISCKYYFYSPIEDDDEIFSFLDQNILVNGTNENCEGYNFLLNEINQMVYKNFKYKNYSYLDIIKIIKKKDKIEEDKEKKKEMKKEKEKENKNKKILSLYDIGELNKEPYYKIIEYKKPIINNNDKNKDLYKAIFIKQLKNDYLIIGGNNSKIYIYNNKYEKIDEKNVFSNIRFISEKNDEQNNNKIKLIICTDENIILIEYDIYKKDYNSNYLDIISCSFCFEISDDYYVLSNAKGTYIYKNLFKLNEKALIKKFNYSYKVGIKINHKLIALGSNSIMPNGKNQLIIYNINLNKIEKEINGYSFNLNTNSLLLIENYQSSNDDDKIIICACKKYSNNQNNGILLVNANIYDNEEIFDPFYETNSYEPNCFSEILYKYNNKEYKTNYFLEGGFDNLKGESQIKLYKINYEYNIYNTTIEFISNIIFDNLNVFNCKINSIIRLKEEGNLIISFSNGNISLFSSPNIKYFLFYEEQEKKGKKYKDMNFYDKEIEDNNKEEDINKEIRMNNKEMFRDILRRYKTGV